MRSYKVNFDGKESVKTEPQVEVLILDLNGGGMA